MESAPPRATLNEVLWRELQALRPELCKRPLRPDKSNQPFKPVSFAAEDKLEDRTDLTEAQRQAQSQKLRDERTQNLRDFYQHVGKMGAGRNSPEEEAPLSALCLSGGGIRSATFNLGVIQALARAGLLGKFDYLSSVSGGGYIASWLQSWIYRQGLEKVLQELGERQDVNPLSPEPGPVDHLREFSNYLTPKLGLFSGDTWTLAAIVIRNLLLNWLVILPLLAMLVTIPQLAYVFTYAGHDSKYGMPLMLAAIAVELFAAFSVHWHRRFGRNRSFTSMRIVSLCVIPIIVAACLLAAAILCLGTPWKATSPDELAAWHGRVWTFSWLWGLGVPLAGWLLMEIFHAISLRFEKSYAAANPEEKRKVRQSFRHTARWELVGIVFSGIVASLLFYGMSKSWLPYLHQRPTLYTVFSVPCLLALYLLARVLFVALASLSESIKQRKVAAGLINDADREWWARMSGWILGLTMLWLAGTSICLFGQWLLVEGSDWVQASIAAAGGIAGALGALMGSRDDTTTTAHPPSLMHKCAMGLAAPLFAVCVIALMAWSTATLGGWLIEDKATFEIPSNLQRPDVVSTVAAYSRFIAVPLVFALAAIVMGSIVNVNRFSLHGMYRNRLVRAYLGASNDKRHPDPFTGFDPADNLRMHVLRPSRPRPASASMSLTETSSWARLMEVTSPIRVHEADTSAPPQRLLPIVNITLNLLRDEKLAWQQRKAESFSVTPYFCGNFFEGYRDSMLYGGSNGITLGTAVTISGAAANPRMGYCSSPALAFLMALFNARLGAWLGNTNRSGKDTYRLPGPGQALWPMIGELFGITTANFKYVNLSDGGHFDNLGLYEVVLRRCRHIVVSDAGCDREARFEDLGNVIRKIRIDFGIPIVFKKIHIIPIGDADQGLYCATAEIQYPAIDGKEVEPGQLVYIKPTIAGRGELPIPYDVYSYSKMEASFPHESTTDQWFSESQFESYRKLGEHCIEQVLSETRPTSIRSLVESADRYLATSQADSSRQSLTSL
jgi:hypothetical protein